jgi:alginate O-acetyltransferase complex protein AlgJ
MRSILRYPTTMVFLALSLAPLALFGIDGPWLGGGPGPALRAPAPFPSRLVPETFRRISTWFNDRIGMRFPLMVLDSHWRFRVWDFRFRDQIIFGDGPWLFFNDDPAAPAARMSDLRGQLRMPDPDIAQLDRQLAAVQAQFAQCGKAAFVVIAPNKQSIYPEELRAGHPYRRSRLDDVLAKLSPQVRAMIIDPRPELREQKTRHGVPVYYRADSHWNELGAYVAYQKIVATLAQAKPVERPDLATLDGVGVHATPVAGGDIATHMLYLPWYFPDDRISLRGKAAEPPLEIESQRDRRLIANPQRQGRLLILSDSFGDFLVGLLARHFHEVEQLSRPTWPAAFDGERVALRKTDAVIIEIAERSLPELLQPPRRLERACG